MLSKITLYFLLFTSFLGANEFRVIRLENYRSLGMFATANQVLGQLYMIETGQLPHVLGLTVDFGIHGLYYDANSGPNWWTYYFEPINVGERGIGKLVYPNQGQYLEGWRQRRLIPREKAAQIIKKYIRIKPHVQEKIDAFVYQHFLDCYTIGIHYRGTDKAKEAPRIAFETVFEEIEKYIPQEKQYVIFVATDEVDFVEQAKERFPNRVVALDALRSYSGGLGVHFANKNNYTIGEEALIDACLLSKCDLLIRTSSNLSLWSTYFNPDLPVVLLNQRYMRTLEAE